MKPLEASIAYSQIGLRPIPIFYKTKRPIGKGWNKNWDMDKVEQTINIYENCNIGILLGPIVDVEADTVEGNALLDDILGGIPHPVFQSNKSKHHLFRNDFNWLTRVCYSGIEFRAHGHQSLFPPSVHPSGSRYCWVETNGFDFPPLPENLTNWLIRRGLIPDLFSGKFATPWCELCGVTEKIMRRRFRLEVAAFKQINCRWRCHKCRPARISSICRWLRNK